LTYPSLIPSLLLLGLSAALHQLARRSARRATDREGVWRAAAVSAFCLALIDAFTLERSGPIWDSETYVRMASRGGLFTGGMAPFCFRILVPAIARLVPAELPISFELINQLSLWAAGTLLYCLLRARGLRHETALVGPCVLILSSFTKFVLWYRFGVDQLALLAIVAVAWALSERRFKTAALLATIAVPGKESSLLLAPFTYGELAAIPRLRNRPLGRLLVMLLFWSGALAAFVVLRTSIPRLSGVGVIVTITGWAQARLRSPKALCEVVLALPKTFGAIPLVALLAGRRWWPIVRREPYAAVTVGVFVLAAMFGASDYERVYFLAIPFVLLICLPLIEAFPLTPTQAAVALAAHVSLLDVFSPPDFMNLQRWFMTNAGWPDMAVYAVKVLLWAVALRAVGLGRERSR
jgi:hypothetical protein